MGEILVLLARSLEQKLVVKRLMTDWNGDWHFGYLELGMDFVTWPPAGVFLFMRLPKRLIEESLAILFMHLEQKFNPEILMDDWN